MKAEPPDHHWRGWFDGSAWPNPGRMGLGMVLVAPDGRRFEHACLAPGSGCNNEAELLALCALLALAADHEVSHLTAYSDSDVAVRYVNGDARTGIARLQRLIELAHGLRGRFERLDLRWLPRHRNLEADAQSRRALGLPPKAAKKPGRRRR